MVTLIDAAAEFGVTLDAAQLNAFELYYHEMIAWNERVNLTAIVERDQVLVKHWMDSFSVAPFVPAGCRLIDIGTGAGFPGLPLKIAIPSLKVTLVDATRKKVDFCQHVVDTLILEHATVLQGRAEDLGQDAGHRERYDVAVARAVAELTVLLEYALPLVRKGGRFCALKGVQVDEEIAGAAHALSTLGGSVHQVVPVQLPGLETRHLIVVDKIRHTPSTYPRRAGLPERNPLR